MTYYLSIAAYCPAILLPGLINLLNAYPDFVHLMSRYPLFKFNPRTSQGFRIWILIQFSFPVLLFVLFFPDTHLFFSSENASGLTLLPYLKLYIKAILVGISFNAAVTSTANLGPLSLNLKSAYDLFLRISYTKIDNEELTQNHEFWKTFQKSLGSSGKEQIHQGLYTLSMHFKANDSLLLQQEIDVINNQLKKIFITKKSIENIAKKIVGLINGNVDAQDLILILSDFELYDLVAQLKPSKSRKKIEIEAAQKK
jgi:hypothetical protein